MKNSQSQRGVIAILVALMLIVLCGLAGLAVDLGYFYLKRTQLQAAADAEALACVIESGSTCPVSTSVSGTNYFPSLTSQYNFTSKFSVSTNNPGDSSLCPSGLYSNCANVTMTDTWNAFFIPVLGFKTLTSTVVAIAGRQGSGMGCVIASSLFTAQGSQGLNGANCSNYFGNVSVTGNPPITGSANYVYNGNSGTLCSTCTPPASSLSQTLTAPPLGGTIVKPTTTGTVSGGFTGSVSGTLFCPNKTTCNLSPGIYNSIDCSASQAVCNLVPTGNSSPSQYTFEFDGDVTGPANNGSMTGNGVVLYFGGSGSVTMNGGGAMTFSAPNIGSCSGTATSLTETVFYGPNVSSFTYGGGSALALTGNIYMPNANFHLSGNGGINMVGTLVTSIYTDSGGGNSGLSVNGSNSCGFSPNGSGRPVLAM